jgi:16S rRNA G1207 methylase RsmC
VEGADQERTGVLVVRAWLEDAGDKRLRARITHTRDVARPGETVIVTAGREEVFAAVRSWLEAFMPTIDEPGARKDGLPPAPSPGRICKRMTDG